MDLDRSRFLKLVTAIGAATASPVACATSTPSEQVPIVSVPLDIKPISDGSAPMAVATQTDAAVATAPEPPPTSLASGGLGIWGLPYDPAAPPKTCSMLKCGGPIKEGMSALRSSCKRLSELLRPEPFQRFMTCMVAQNNTPNTCDLLLVGMDPGDCLEKWSSPPAVDPVTAAKCKPIVAACAGSNRSVHAGGPLTMEACQKMFSVTNARSDRKMVHCAIEYCDGAPGLCYLSY